MKPSPIKSLTPFMASGLKSPSLYKMCIFLNVLFCLVAVITTSISALWNLTGMGWLLSGVVAFLIFWIIGTIIQLCEVISINDDIRIYNNYVNNVFTQINIEMVQRTPDIDTKQYTISNALPMIDFSVEDIVEIKSPFVSAVCEASVDHVLSACPDHSIKSDSAKAIAEALVELNKEATPSYRLLKTNVQKNIITWLSKKYFDKLSTDEFNSLYTAKKADMYKEEWKEKFKPLFSAKK